MARAMVATATVVEVNATDCWVELLAVAAPATARYIATEKILLRFDRSMLLYIASSFSFSVQIKPVGR